MAIQSGGAPLSIAHGIREFAHATPAATAVIDRDRRQTYAELHERSSRLAQHLLSSGHAIGDKVAVLLGNRLEFPEIAAGLAKAGLVMVPLNPRLTAAEATYIVEHSDVRTVVLDGALSPIVEPVATSRDLSVLTLDAGPLGTSYEDALAAADPSDPEIRVDERDPFCITYTSGTTGKPKGVLISHRSRVLTIYMSALEWGLGTGRVSAAVAPMYHGAGFAFGYAPVFTGGTVTMLNRWDPAAFLDLVERDGVQSAFLIPTHAQGLRALGPDAIAARDLTSLDTLYFNAAALPWALKQWVMETFAQCGVHELYGSTEAGIVTNLRPADMRRKPGSVGHPWFMTEVRVVDDAGNPVGPGEPGELFSRSPYLMNGYLNDPEATAACTTEDGFVTCGDIVTVDEEGYISIVDRKKDLIISGGTNVYPREIEEVLASHAAVVECAVVGEPDEEWGERVVAHVVLTSGASLDSAGLEAHCRAQLAGYKLPRRWYAIEALPRNAGGKILKRALTPPAVPAP
ncbi:MULTISPECIES: class I adenylate-forming enzyme family protein [Mumia]|uniref:class I adenylate-forming enzyme family protein n=1 Tax=Mumia TaxID=1546255 RepID=UPI0014203A6F|nr:MULTISPECIES: AMP-binding protein [unclassified Mumia]QMW66250.1 AMP-binding protein [Mumia sp. ZJ1417]